MNDFGLFFSFAPHQVFKDWMCLKVLVNPVTNGAGNFHSCACAKPHLEKLCVWQTFGLLTTHRQEPSCSTGPCQLSTQVGLWESQTAVCGRLDVTPLFQTSMLALSGNLHWGAASRKVGFPVFCHNNNFNLSINLSRHNCSFWMWW